MYNILTVYPILRISIIFIIAIFVIYFILRSYFANYDLKDNTEALNSRLRLTALITGLLATICFMYLGYFYAGLGWLVYIMLGLATICISLMLIAFLKKKDLMYLIIFIISVIIPLIFLLINNHIYIIIKVYYAPLIFTIATIIFVVKIINQKKKNKN